MSPGIKAEGIQHHHTEQNQRRYKNSFPRELYIRQGIFVEDKVYDNEIANQPDIIDSPFKERFGFTE
jgi:hypothetical protein